MERLLSISPIYRKILFIFFSDVDPGFGDSLYGHSLSWTDEKSQFRTLNNKLFAKLWIPDLATEQDLANLTNFSSDFPLLPE